MPLINVRVQNIGAINDNSTAEPFLRWAGGKRWLLKHLNKMFPDLEYTNYHEPFLGSAALFFFLKPQRNSFLSDLNSELIDTYSAVQSNIELVISELEKFSNTKEGYYKIRGTKFRNDFKKAARFIYLNQTSFNGIYRVNLKGEYNVPYGYRTKDFLDSRNLRAASMQLKKTKISISDFEDIRQNIQKKDLVFLDPPYTVTHNNNGFIKYNQKLFSLDDQYRLSEFIDYIDKMDAYYILTNAAHSTVEKIFEKGHNKFTVERASLIGGINAKRGYYKEVIFSNIDLK